MSWSVNFIGAPDKVIKALENHSTQIGSGTSKDEFDAALPHLIGLVAKNFNNVGQNTATAIKIDANGTGYVGMDGKPQYGSCNVTIQQLYGVLV